jgi:hypothetical protein
MGNLTLDEATIDSTLVYANELRTIPMAVVREATVSLSEAQIESLDTIPINIVSAPGVGKVILPLGFLIQYTFVTTQYNTVNVELSHAGEFQFRSMGSIMNQTASVIKGGAITTGIMPENTAVQVSLSGDPGTAGDSTLKVTLYYVIKTL